MDRYFDVAIVGAGHAGAQTAITLRQRGFAGSIAIFGEEPEVPYDRPPLSKEYLAGDKTFDRLQIRPADFWNERGVAMLLGQPVVWLDPSAARIQLQDGSTAAYGALVWAAGGHARPLTCPGNDLGGVHSVRNRADVDRIIAELPRAERVVVIGGGYIGLEAAAVLTKLGKAVTVVEALDRVLARVAGEPLSRFFEAEHRAHGVVLRLNAKVEALEGEAGRVRAVRLEDGERLSADMVIVGVGIVPAVQPLLAAGAVGANGVLVDAHCRTSLPAVYAVGDCALHSNAFADGREIRLESVQNANDQAQTAAMAILGEPAAYAAVPWFWSNQYDLRLQTIGLSTGHDDLVVRGDMARRSFSVVYLKRGRVLAIDCVNATKDYVQAKALIVGCHAPDRAALADPSVPLKSLIAQPA